MKYLMKDPGLAILYRVRSLCVVLWAESNAEASTHSRQSCSGKLIRLIYALGSGKDAPISSVQLNIRAVICLWNNSSWVWSTVLTSTDLLVIAGPGWSVLFWLWPFMSTLCTVSHYISYDSLCLFFHSERIQIKTCLENKLVLYHQLTTIHHKNPCQKKKKKRKKKAN